MSLVTEESRIIELKPVLICLAMLIAAVLAVILKPSEKSADQIERIGLENMIPKQFGDWRLDDSVMPVLTTPEQKQKLNTLYSETLARTYVNAQGQRIMLSIAYGGNQTDAMEVHKPEICYPSQGYPILQNRPALLQTKFGNIPVRRLVASRSPLIEPITYWITIGGEISRSYLFKKFHKLQYTLTGKVPDGLLFRVSTISASERDLYSTQDQFIETLLKSIGLEYRKRLIGTSDENDR